MADGGERVGSEERIVLPRRGAAAIACTAGILTVSAVEDGGVQVDFDDDSMQVMLRVTEAIELHDGDLVSIGRQWLSYEAGSGTRAPRLHQLDGEGRVQMTLMLHGRSLTLGREVGDVMWPGDDELSELHVQILVRHGVAYVHDLATATGTWILVGAGEVLQSDSTIAVGDRLLRIATPPPMGSGPEPIDRKDDTSVYAAA